MNWSTPINSRFPPSCRTMQPAASIARPISINCWTDCANRAQADGLRTGQTSTILGTIGQESKRRASGGFEARWSKPPSPSPMCGRSPKLWDSQIGISRQLPASLPEFPAAFRSRSKVSVAWSRPKIFYRLKAFAMCAYGSMERSRESRSGRRSFPRLNQPDLRAHISARLRKAGFRFVCVDLEGYRPGGVSLG